MKFYITSHRYVCYICNSVCQSLSASLYTKLMPYTVKNIRIYTDILW